MASEPREAFGEGVRALEVHLEASISPFWEEDEGGAGCRLPPPALRRPAARPSELLIRCQVEPRDHHSGASQLLGSETSTQASLLSEITSQATPETLGALRASPPASEDGAEDVEILLGPTPLANMLPLQELSLDGQPLKSHEKCWEPMVTSIESYERYNI